VALTGELLGPTARLPTHTCEFAMTWLASSLIGKGTPSSDANELIGDKVPDVRIIDLACSPSSENTYKQIKMSY